YARAVPTWVPTSKIAGYGNGLAVVEWLRLRSPQGGTRSESVLRRLAPARHPRGGIRERRFTMFTDVDAIARAITDDAADPRYWPSSFVQPSRQPRARMPTPVTG